jgi:DHA1 family bicyclomycin/chloramphenicol resistance-like MFS transporter
MKKCLFLIIVIFIAACIETDIYLPAFPDMMRAFSSTEGAIQGLLTWNFIGICVSGPLYGPLSDAYGRKKPLIIALLLFLFGSILTCVAQDLNQMLYGRILQGLGSGGCFTLGTAIVFDSFQKEKAIKALNFLNMIIPLIMAGAPLLGAYLNYTFGFRSNFLTIAAFVFVSLCISLFFFDESLAVEKRTSFNWKGILRDFKLAFSCLAFWQITLAISLLFAGYISFLSGSSVLFVLEFGISKALFPLFQAAVLGAWIAGGLMLNSILAKWVHAKVKRAGMFLAIVGVVELAVAAIAFPTNAWVITLGMLLYSFGANWIIGLYFPESMEILPSIKGVTSSLVTSVRLLIAAVVIGIASYLYNGTIYPLAGIVCGGMLAIVPMLRSYEKRRATSSEAG